MDHPWRGDWDLQVRNNFSLLINERVVHHWLFSRVAEGKHLASFPVDLGMSRHVVSELTIEVVVTDAEDVEVLLRSVHFDVEGVISLEESVCPFLVVIESCVCYSIFIFVELVTVTNLLLKLKEKSLEESSS